jgi:hypothetical protein
MQTTNSKNMVELHNLKQGDIIIAQGSKYVFIDYKHGRDIIHVTMSSVCNSKAVFNLKIRKTYMGGNTMFEVVGNNIEKAIESKEVLANYQEKKQERQEANAKANMEFIKFDMERGCHCIMLRDGTKVYEGDRVKVQFTNGTQVGYVGKIAGTKELKFGYKFQQHKQNRMLNISMILNKVN